MKNRTLVLSPLLFCLVFFMNSLLLASTDQEAAAKAFKPLIEQNQRVLSGRIYKLLESRLSSKNLCSPQFNEELRAQFSKLPAYSADRATTLQTLSLYLRSYIEAKGDCLHSLNENEQRFHQAERSQFKSIHKMLEKFCVAEENTNSVSKNQNCKFKTQQFFADLDPHCVTVQVPNATGTYDPFPCMAADYLIGKNLVNSKTWQSFLFRAQQFQDNFRTALGKRSAKSEGIDLWSLYLEDNPDREEIREIFLAEMNFYFSSFHSSSSYIRGFHDHIWSFVLFQSKSAEAALDYFNASRLLVDQFRTLHDWAKKNKIPLNLRGISMAEKNRHNYMAAYLACHYRKESRVFHESLPILLGYAYEGLDFESHYVDDKDSFSLAYENFKTDTHRYRTGAYWGHRFCKMKF